MSRQSSIGRESLSMQHNLPTSSRAREVCGLAGVSTCRVPVRGVPPAAVRQLHCREGVPHSNWHVVRVRHTGQPTLGRWTHSSASPGVARCVRRRAQLPGRWSAAALLCQCREAACVQRVCIAGTVVGVWSPCRTACVARGRSSCVPGRPRRLAPPESDSAPTMMPPPRCRAPPWRVSSVVGLRPKIFNRVNEHQRRQLRGG
jgi:hypothetical protein